jgi:hypothetical protein
MSRADHVRFCHVEGWSQVRRARGTATSHHETYELGLLDGRVLRTRISRPVNRDTYGSSMAQHILRDQLEVSRDEFWRCVREEIKPDRGLPEAPTEALPADLAYLLIHRVGMPERQVAGLTKEQALKILTEYWSATPPG